ncbi:MAG TPA: folylpolyglutamate synthase/dihydrofolate synthase family protein [Chloroflexota bacterium]|nr:folylpolyglutamate synthase/dihydrofolate synthase family protein [Chloroflexota bacterium]
MAGQDLSDAIRFLYQQPDFFETRYGHTYATAGTNLGRVSRLLDLLDRPDKTQPCAIVAGTKGKGSTAATLAAIFQAAGYQTGLYTQPHLHSIRERFALNGEPISAREIIAAVARVRPVLDHLLRCHADELGVPTSYEVQTVVAMVAFEHSKMDVAVLEVGLGGRLDAVNAVDASVVGITPISLDHTSILGDTISAIAAEKAGVIKNAQSPVVCAPQSPDAERVIVDTTHRRCARLIRIGRDVAVGHVLRRQLEPMPRQDVQIEWRGQALRVATPLMGDHQAVNLSVAATMAAEFASRGLTIGEEHVQAGCALVRWPGRFEIVPGQPTVVLDGAQNDGSARALADALRSVYPNRRVIFLIGVSSDKDIDAIARALFGVVGAVVATRSGHPRSASPETVATAFERLGLEVRLTQDVGAGLKMAHALADGDDLICVTGSLFVVADGRRSLNLPGSELSD